MPLQFKNSEGQVFWDALAGLTTVFFYTVAELYAVINNVT